MWSRFTGAPGGKDLSFGEAGCCVLRGAHGWPAPGGGREADQELAASPVC